MCRHEERDEQQSVGMRLKAGRQTVDHLESVCVERVPVKVKREAGMMMMVMVLCQTLQHD